MKLSDYSPGKKRQAIRDTLHEKLKGMKGIEVAPATHVLPQEDPNDDRVIGTKLRSTTDVVVPLKSSKKK